MPSHVVPAGDGAGTGPAPARSFLLAKIQKMYKLLVFGRAMCWLIVQQIQAIQIVCIAYFDFVLYVSLQTIQT